MRSLALLQALLRGALALTLGVALCRCAASAGTADAASPDGGCTGRSTFAPCVHGARGGVCDTATSARVCANGQWVCPPGTLPGSLCGCFGATTAACVCSGDLPLCQPTAAPPDAGDECGAMPPFYCSQGAAGRVCGDYGVPPMCVRGHWQCDSGFVPFLKCGCSIWDGSTDGGAFLLPGTECPVRDPSGG